MYGEEEMEAMLRTILLSFSLMYVRISIFLRAGTCLTGPRRTQSSEPVRLGHGTVLRLVPKPGRARSVSENIPGRQLPEDF